MKISDHLVQYSTEEFDFSVLVRESFPVNIRLYKSNVSYRNVILEIIRYMDEHLNTHFDDYADPKGVAAANLGFPFRIIGYKKKTSENQFFLNPKITHRSAGTVAKQTNCGSLRLATPVTVTRHHSIDIEYYDLAGEIQTKQSITSYEGGFTIQHEMDLIDGKMITQVAIRTDSVVH